MKILHRVPHFGSRHSAIENTIPVEFFNIAFNVQCCSVSVVVLKTEVQVHLDARVVVGPHGGDGHQEHRLGVKAIVGR
jgi:hypothetical protein